MFNVVFNIFHFKIKFKKCLVTLNTCAEINTTNLTQNSCENLTHFNILLFCPHEYKTIFQRHEKRKLFLQQAHTAFKKLYRA